MCGITKKLIRLLALGALVTLPALSQQADNSVTVTAEFDPPLAASGQKIFYRVNVTAAEAAIAWPKEIVTPPDLPFGANVRGQTLLPQGPGEHPLTAFVYEVKPVNLGTFTVSNFNILANGQSVTVPAASLTVVSNLHDAGGQRELTLETSATNLYVGQPFEIRLRLPAAAGNQVDFLRDIRLNDDGLLLDKMSLRQTAQSTNQNGQSIVSTVTELTVTPITVGARRVTAQAFIAGRNFSGTVTITGQVMLLGGSNVPKYALYVSAPQEINVRPLPTQGELPGFTGSLGEFFMEPPLLATNRLRVGEPVHLKINFVSQGELTRFVPPLAPRSRDWQIIADKAPAIGFTLIPLNDEVHATPIIPFSSFNPTTGKYVNLTIPAVPVTVSAEGLPVQLDAYDDGAKTAPPLRLNDPATRAGARTTSLRPLQLQGWFVGLQLVPVIGFLALWQWDRRRQFLEAHPEIVRKRNARRALRKIKRQLQNAVASGDSDAFGRLAATAFQVVVAPHYPANPAALVSGDVLSRLSIADAASERGQIVRRIFAAADARFANNSTPPADLLTEQIAVLDVLRELEEQL